MDIDPSRLESVLASNPEHGKTESQTLIQQGRTHAEDYAMESMESALGKAEGIEIIKPSPKTEQAFDKIQNLGLESPIPREQANWLHDTLGADAVLRFGITDYGLTPRAWRKGYITFEVTSTLAIAGIIAYSGSTAAKAAAGAYLAQETVEETAEAYTGFWALDVVSRPVRIEAELIQLNPLETVWKDSDTGLSYTKLSRLTRKVPVEEEHIQLDQSTKDSARELVARISAALLRYLPLEPTLP